ncbi:MAG: hypothetical protein WCL08_00065 [Verrucomicrobiota bacterium]
MKTAVISVTTPNFHPVSDITTPTHFAFAKRHGYHYECMETTTENCMWDKVDLIRHYLNVGYDRVLWIDADAAVTNVACILDYIVPQTADAGVYLTEDINGINSGVMLIVNHPLVQQFMHAVCTHGKTLFGTDPTPEQQAIRHFSQENRYKNVVKFVTQTMMNSYFPNSYDYPGAEEAWWQESDFILHLPGITNDVRIEILNKTLGK